MTDPAFERLASNGAGFLLRSVKDASNRPDMFAVGVYTAIELFLKARLAHEHWSLMVSRSPDRARFETGDFVSVTFEEACNRLRDVLQDPLPDETRDAFNALRMIRNRIVHFSPPGVEAIGVDATRTKDLTRATALKAWALLVELLVTRWAGPFSELSGLVEEIGDAGRRTQHHLNPGRGDRATGR